MLGSMKHLRFVLFFAAVAAGARDVRVGVARIDISPTEPTWLSGYAVRVKPSEGAVHKLWAKALTIEDGRTKTVIVTTDLIGLPRAVSDVVAARAAKEYGIERAHLLLNSSHTHSGPVVRPNLMTMYTLTADQSAVLDRYANSLVDKLVTLIGASLSDLAPARLSIAHGSAEFGVNRRVKGRNGYSIGVNRAGPVDHDVPVLAVHSPQGKLRAVLFGYACHNTTLPGEFYQASGDYAGFAQLAVETAQPGATALFLMLCGGDQNPEPRGKLEQAEAHGAALGAVVNRILDSRMTPVQPGVRAAWQSTEIVFAPHSREQFEKETQSTNKFEAARAREMLRAYDQGRPVRRSPYPVQAIRLGTASGKPLALVALGGEVVVDYALRAKREYAGLDLVVAGYSNDVMCYIGSKRIIQEGGYEGLTSMIYYGQPGALSEEVEETIFDAIHKAMTRIGIKRSTK